MFPSVLRAIKECNQQLWKSWNTCVESLQDRTVVRKTLGGESERNGSLSSLRDIFAENLQSALRLFIDNDLEVSCIYLHEIGVETPHLIYCKCVITITIMHVLILKHALF